MREHWIVDPANRMIEGFSLGETGYGLHSFAADPEQVTSRVLDGFVGEVAGE